MAYPTMLPSRYFLSWDKKTEIVLDLKIENNQYKAKIAINQPDTQTNYAIDWVDFEDKLLCDVIFEHVPLFKEDAGFLPLVEDTSFHRRRVALCSSFVLKDGRKFKQYVPLKRYTLEVYKAFRERPSSIPGIPGEITDIVELVEE